MASIGKGHRRCDFNGQLGSWLVKANDRIHATTKVRPDEAAYEDRGARLGFPPVLPDTAWRFSTRLARDHVYESGQLDVRATDAPIRGRLQHLEWVARPTVVLAIPCIPNTGDWFS